MGIVLNFQSAGSAATPLTAAMTLTKNSGAAAVRAVLVMAVSASLDHLEQAELIAVIATRTVFSKRDLRKMLNALIEDAELTAPDGPAELADAVLEDCYGGLLKAGPDGRLWRYSGTCWKTVPDSTVRREISNTFRKAPAQFGGGKTKASVDAAFAILRDRCGVDADPMAITLDPPNVLNFQNGELWLTGEELKLQPHNPLSGLVHALPISYDPEATSPRFMSALGEIFSEADEPEEMVRHVLEVVGYAIQSVRNLPRIVVLHGSGANGKSSLLRVLTALVGTELVYSSSVSVLSRDRFAAAGLAGRLLFIDDDVKAGITLDDGQLKTISEAKLLSVRRAYGKAEFSFKALSLPVLATNNVPRVKDASHGFERRLMVIPFDRRFTKAEINPDLFDEIIATELPGIINVALVGLQRLRERGDFHEPADCLHAKQSFLAQAIPLRGFASACLIASEGARTPLKLVYDALLIWCSNNGIPRPFPRNCLKSRLESMGLVTGKSNGLTCLHDLVIAPMNASE